MLAHFNDDSNEARGAKKLAQANYQLIVRRLDWEPGSPDARAGACASVFAW